MIFPGAITCGDSDDENSVAPLPSLNRSSEDDAKKMQDSFMLSKSGTFKVEDFNINKGGLLAASASADAKEGSPGGGLEVNSIDELEVGDELGAGASGTVFRAKHKPTGTIVAVKCVTILEKAKRDQVVAELRIMRKNASPWLVSMHNAFYEEAKVYQVLEFMDHGSIADLIKRHKGGLRDERELGKIALQLLNGLSYLHKSRHQVHRDLKPANALVNAAGNVKISDFGISSQLDSTAAFCSTFVGTTCYMSPERLQGDSYSYASDIWSLGLILLELATGRYPYGDNDSYFKLLGRINDSDPPTVPEDGGFSDGFAEFIGLCLEKDPSRRPGARELLKHPWLRQYPLMDDLLLSGLFGSMKIEERTMDVSDRLSGMSVSDQLNVAPEGERLRSVTR